MPIDKRLPNLHAQLKEIVAAVKSGAISHEQGQKEIDRLKQEIENILEEYRKMIK